MYLSVANVNSVVLVAWVETLVNVVADDAVVELELLVKASVVVFGGLKQSQMVSASIVTTQISISATNNTWLQTTV